jgi:hypothetical protein
MAVWENIMNKNYLRAFALILLLTSSFNVHAWNFSFSSLRPSFSLPGKRYVSSGYNMIVGFLCAGPLVIADKWHQLRSLTALRQKSEDNQRRLVEVFAEQGRLAEQRDKHGKRLDAFGREQVAIRDGLRAMPGQLEEVRKTIESEITQQADELGAQLQENDAVVKERLVTLVEQQRDLRVAFDAHEQRVTAEIKRGQARVDKRLGAMGESLAEKEQRNAAILAAVRVQMEANSRKREKLARQAKGISARIEARRAADREELGALSDDMKQLTGLCAALGQRHQAMARQLEGRQSKGLPRVRQIDRRLPAVLPTSATSGSLEEVD